MKSFLFFFFLFVFYFKAIFSINSLDTVLFAGHDNIKTLNTVDGAFPSIPSYAVYQKYQDNQCLTFQGIESVLLDTCLFSHSGSRMYTCVSGEAIYNRYSDVSCSILTDVHEINDNCNGKIHAILLSCSTSNPFSFQDEDYFTQTMYQDSACSNALGAVGIVNGLCRPTEGTRSIRYEWPYWTYYTASSACEGSHLLPTNVTTLGCFYMGANDDDALRYDSFSQYSYISKQGGDRDENAASSNRALSAGAIVGIAVVGATGIALIGAALYYYFNKAKTSLNTHQHQQVGIEQVTVA